MSHLMFCSAARYSYCWYDNQCILRRQLVPFLFFTHSLWFGNSKTSTEYPHLLYGEGLANRGRSLFGKNGSLCGLITSADGGTQRVPSPSCL